MESPSNPLCKVTDIQSVCNLVQEITLKQDQDHNITITTAVDSTWSPPYLTQPLRLGADVVVHSGTKYLAGHSDALIGTVTTSPYTTQGQRLGPSIRSIQISLGATASPMDCYLTLRGLRTLHIRLERQCHNAMILSKYLSNHPLPLVKAVHYPGLTNHPQHNIATHQMKNGLYGGMFSFEVDNQVTAMAVAGALMTIKRATSLGSSETLIEHRASIEPEDGRVSPEGLLRVSVGLENVEDLKADLEIALKIASEVVSSQSMSSS